MKILLYYFKEQANKAACQDALHILKSKEDGLIDVDELRYLISKMDPPPDQEELE